MHLFFGFIQVMLAYFLASLYRVLRLDWIGRGAVRLCCAAFTAGAGIDDEAIKVVRSLGDDGIRMLKHESKRQGERSIAAFLLKVLETANDV